MSLNDLKLIYQPIPPEGSDDAFASALRSVVLESAAVDIVSPYLSLEILQRLVDGRRFRLVTDQEACFEAGCEPAFYEFLKEHEQFIRSLAGLHAKVVLGEHEGLFGSANLTKTGIGRRFEMASIVRRHHLDELKTWFEALWSHSDPLDLLILADQQPERSAYATPRDSAHAGLTKTGRLGWLAGAPRQRSQPVVLGGGGMLPPSSGVEAHELEEFAERLVEVTHDRETADRVLCLLARALEHTALPAGDERLQLNYSRRNRISIGLGGRHVGWCRREGKIREFVMMLQSFEIADQAVATIPNARQKIFSRNKKPWAPLLYLPMEEIVDLNPMIIDDWEQAISRELQVCGRSPYLRHKRESLYYILLDPALRRTVVSLAHPLI